MTLFSDLSTLEAAGLIQVAKVEPDLEYNFRHTLVQDAAYASLLESDRKRLHLAVGDAIESLYPDRRKELAAILGYHFKEAGQDERALSYFKIAGDAALSGYANQEAEIQYRRALELICCSGDEIARLYSGLGEALYRQSRLEEALQAQRTSIDIYKSLGDSDGIARLYSRVARVSWYAGDRPESLQICLEGLELVKDAPNSLGKATLIHETARAYHFNGMSDKALTLCRQALSLAEQLGAIYVQADSLATLGILSGISAEESLEALRESVDLAEANGLLQVAMRAHQNLGTMIRRWLADNQTALEHFHRSAELGKMRGVASEEIIGQLSYLSCLFTPGRIQEVEAELPHMEDLVGKISNPAPMQLAVQFLKGELTWYKGDWDSAISIHRKILASWRELKNLEGILSFIDEISLGLLEMNRWGELADLSEIERLLVEAVKIVDQDDSNEKYWIYPRMSILRARQGRPDEARQWLDKTRQAVAASPSTWDGLFQGECEFEIATADQNWIEALAAIEKNAMLEARLGLHVRWAKSLLCWAVIHLNRGGPDDMDRAQTLLRESLAEFNHLSVGHYPQIVQDKLQLIRTRTRDQALDHEKMTQELKKARQVQESLLPENLPELPGWELAVVLEPAHETSGDFYDFLPLPEGRLGLVIADVTDKGTSAALFMALSRSLWRTFAVDYPAEPEKTIAETNRRILADTHGGLFITLFYGILNFQDGNFYYCNAGHHPAYLVRGRDGSIEELGRTGIPLGVLKETSWSRECINVEVGDALVLYTDGITDALNAEEQFYGQERLKEAVRRNCGKPAKEMHEALLAGVRDWVGGAQQFDDITLMVIVRGKVGAH
jgi:serine phosphatase RsbU (regulator of sigma subunit)